MTPLDILPIGHKRVTHEVLIERGDALGDLRLAIGPLRGLHVFELVEEGRPYRISSKYGTRLFALEDAQELGPETRASDLDGLPKGPVFHDVYSVVIGHPLASVLTTYRVLDVQGDAITVERVDEVWRDADGDVVNMGVFTAVALTLAAAGALGVVALLRRSRRAHA